MALALIANYTIKAGSEEKAKEYMRIMEEHSRREPGCLQYIAHQSEEDPRRFAFYEQYDDKAAFDAHCASPHFEQYITKGLATLAESRVRNFFHTIS
jgi:quinol monooxygenase YgiN